MAKGDGVQPPLCKNCGDAHWRQPGKVCPKFRTPVDLKPPPPPKPLCLPAPKIKGKKPK